MFNKSLCWSFEYYKWSAWAFWKCGHWMQYGGCSSIPSVQLLLKDQPLSPGFPIFVSSLLLLLFLCLRLTTDYTVSLGWIFLPDAWVYSFSLWALKSPSHLHCNPKPGQASQPYPSFPEKWKRKRTYFHIHMCIMELLTFPTQVIKNYFLPACLSLSY